MECVKTSLFPVCGDKQHYYYQLLKGSNNVLKKRQKLLFLSVQFTRIDYIYYLCLLGQFSFMTY